MTGRGARATLLALAACLGAACGPAGRPGTPPRHALLVTVSGLRADRITALGYPRPTTAPARPPADGVDLSVDGLVRTGVAFPFAFAPAADDAASLASLLDARGAPLAEAFAAAGYRTAAFVAGDAAEQDALLRGFDHVAPAAGDDPDYAAASACTRWVRDVGLPAGEPLFVWLHLAGPAAPWEPAPLGEEDLRARFVDPDYAGPIDGSAESLAALAALADPPEPAAPLDGLGRTHLANLYDAEVARAARLVEHVASALAGRFGLLPRNLLAETAVVLAGTRGVELFQHGPRAEDPRSLFDASLRVPLVVRHPASLTGKRCLDDLVELADVPATLRDWFGLAPAAGRSLLALTDSHVERAFERRPVVVRGPDGGSVRTAERHLIVRGDERLLFAPRRDPLERVDLAAEEPETVARLLARLRGGP